MKKRGSITLEAAIVMPIVLAVSIVMVYFMLIHYEKVTLSAFCHNYAEGIAKYSNAKYTKESEANQTEKYFYQDKLAWKTDLGERKYKYPIYWRFYANYMPGEQGLTKKLEARMIFKHGSKLSVKKESGFLSSYIIVSGQKRVREIIPILRVLGIYQDGVLITARAKVAVVDQPERIRNICLIKDAVRLVGGGQIMDQIKNTLKQSLDTLLQ